MRTLGYNHTALEIWSHGKASKCQKRPNDKQEEVHAAVAPVMNLALLASHHHITG